MSYCVKKNEDVSGAVRRIAAEEIHAVIAELRSVPLLPVNIHEARRHLKKLRALLRLVRKQFPTASFKKENQILRSASKMLSPIRDARVISKALASLKTSTGKTQPGFHFLTAALHKECDRRVMGKDELISITKLLRTALDRVENWPLAKLGHREVRAALERSFRRCKKAFRESLRTEKDEAFHEWRKRVKDLEYHLCLFETAWRKTTRRAWKEVKRLDDSLGEDHDLVLLSAKLRHFKFKSEEFQNDENFIAAICKRRAKLQRCAMKIGKDLFKERPKSFVCRKIRL